MIAPDLRRARDLLGKLAADPHVKEAQSSSLLQYTLNADKERKTVAVKAGKQQYSAEELVVSFAYFIGLSSRSCACKSAHHGAHCQPLSCSV